VPLLVHHSVVPASEPLAFLLNESFLGWLLERCAGNQGSLASSGLNICPRDGAFEYKASWFVLDREVQWQIAACKERSAGKSERGWLAAASVVGWRSQRGGLAIA
jgi:hypothetical protein